jgi:hypothetical protein
MTMLMSLARRAAAILLLALLAALPARATVNSTVNKTIALGNGVTTAFQFNFIGVAAAYISVILTDASGNQTVLTPGAGATQYQITLNPPVSGATWGVGGTVTYNPSGTPIPSGSTLTIFRTLPLTQAISLQRMNSLSTLGNGAETGLDTGTMQLQQVSENIARAIVAPVSDPTPPAPLPPIAQRANQGAAFESSGNLVAGSTPSSGVISSAMQPVVNAATLALGRAAFGLGSAAVENIGCGLEDDGAGSLRVNSGLTSVATNQAVNASFCSRTYVATGPINFTLDRANTLWNGFTFTVVALSGPITLVPNANDSILGEASGTSVAIPANSVAVVTTDGATFGNWRVRWSPWAVTGTPKGLVLPLIAGPGISVTGVGTVAQSLSNATLQANPTPGGVSNAAGGIMMGMGTTCKITPVYSGRIKVEWFGSVSNTVGSASIGVTMRYGTGVAPIYTNGPVGTQIAASYGISAPNTNFAAPLANGGIVTGLTPGVAYWLDLTLSSGGGGVSTLSNVSCNAMEF